MARRQQIAALVSGILFGAGLAVSQMINPEKILNFLDFTANWDPSLGLVMAAGLAVSALGFKWVLGMEGPLLDARFHLPVKREIDAPLLGGALLFGMGWGLAGYCPGPGLAAMTLGVLEPVIFTAAVLLGFQLQSLVRRG